MRRPAAGHQRCRRRPSRRRPSRDAGPFRSASVPGAAADGGDRRGRRRPLPVGPPATPTCWRWSSMAATSPGRRAAEVPGRPATPAVRRWCCSTPTRPDFRRAQSGLVAGGTAGRASHEAVRSRKAPHATSRWPTAPQQLEGAVRRTTPPAACSCAAPTPSRAAAMRCTCARNWSTPAPHLDRRHRAPAAARRRRSRKSRPDQPGGLQPQRRGLVQPGREVREAQDTPTFVDDGPLNRRSHRRLDRPVAALLPRWPGCRRRTRPRLYSLAASTATPATASMRAARQIDAGTRPALHQRRHPVGRPEAAEPAGDDRARAWSCALDYGMFTVLVAAESTGCSPSCTS